MGASRDGLPSPAHLTATSVSSSLALLQAFEAGVVGSRLRVPSHKNLFGVLFWDVYLKDPHSHTQALAGILTEHLLSQCQMYISITLGAVPDAVMVCGGQSLPRLWTLE